MRINKGHIDIIVERAIKASFEKREVEQEKEENALAVKAYNSLFDATLRKKVAVLPKEWLRHCSCLRFIVNGQYHHLNAAEDMPTPASNGCGNLGNLKGDIGEEVIAFANAKQDLKKEKCVAENKLRATLSNISTFAKLAELWPEGKPFYADLDEDAKVKGGLPAIRFDDVNAMLKIPPTKTAA